MPYRRPIFRTRVWGGGDPESARSSSADPQSRAIAGISNSPRARPRPEGRKPRQTSILPRRHVVAVCNRGRRQRSRPRRGRQRRHRTELRSRHSPPTVVQTRVRRRSEPDRTPQSSRQKPQLLKGVAAPSAQQPGIARNNQASYSMRAWSRELPGSAQNREPRRTKPAIPTISRWLSALHRNRRVTRSGHCHRWTWAIAIGTFNSRQTIRFRRTARPTTVLRSRTRALPSQGKWRRLRSAANGRRND